VAIKFALESEELKKSNWPKCDELARKLELKGVEAVPSLEAALKSRTKHVRAAALRSIAVLDSNRGVELARELLKDKAYEVREAAAVILGVPTP